MMRKGTIQPLLALLYTCLRANRGSILAKSTGQQGCLTQYRQDNHSGTLPDTYVTMIVIYSSHWRTNFVDIEQYQQISNCLFLLFLL